MNLKEIKQKATELSESNYGAMMSLCRKDVVLMCEVLESAIKFIRKGAERMGIPKGMCQNELDDFLSKLERMK